MASDDLLPCPFCGGEAERQDFETVGTELGNDPNAGGSCICCKACGASSPVHFDRKENLYSSWNERAALDAAAAVDGDAGWMPIETAPLDTDVVLAWRVEWPEPMWKQQIGWAGKSNSCTKESGYSDAWFHGTATHWKPLDAPPSAH